MTTQLPRHNGVLLLFVVVVVVSRGNYNRLSFVMIISLHDTRTIKNVIRNP